MSTTQTPSCPPLVRLSQNASNPKHASDVDGKEENGDSDNSDSDNDENQTLAEWAANSGRELSPQRLRKRLCIRSNGDDSSSKSNTSEPPSHDDSDDDDVEFLFTLPPSPKKKATSVTPIPPSTTLHRQEIAGNPLSSTSNQQSPDYDDSSPSSTAEQGEESLRRVLWKIPEAKISQDLAPNSKIENSGNITASQPSSNNQQPTSTAALDASTGKNSEKNKAASSLSSVTEKEISETHVSEDDGIAAFSFQSSAYVQSLAEICHSILYDARWRVGSSQRLFTWERGDDLSAVIAFARRFISTKLSPNTSRCCCFLCKDRKEICETAPCIEQDEEDCKTPDDNDSVDNEACDRSLNLYARIYFRKGPWFRVDDLYKYYAPKPQTSSTPTPQSPGNMASAKQKANSPSKFFDPVTKRNNNSSRNRALESYIDQELITSQLDSVGLLLDDLERLHRMGLIRSFQDEEECGKTVGEVHGYGLLRQDEQGVILVKLGGSRNCRQKEKQNLIWKQMCQQQSISGLSQRRENKNHFLPVSKHVDDALLQSWSTSIVLKASQKEYLPSAYLRSMSEQVKSSIVESIAHRQLNGLSKLCLRLREAPVRSLRRCCRLYLCATSGPGDMRADGTNCWKSLPDSHSKDLSRLPLVTRVVPPPGSHSWHQVSYPGQAHRFKLISCSFLRAHRPILVKSMQEDSTQLMHIQVFPDIYSFEVWEVCVVIRHNVDFLLECNDILHYTSRRRARERSEDEIMDVEDGDDSLNDSSKSEGKYDSMDLLTKSGRRRMIDSFFPPKSRNMQVNTNLIGAISDQVEQDVAMLLGYEEENARIQNNESSRLKNECEQILGVIAAIAIIVLTFRNRTVSDEEGLLICSRPWLRHLCWEGCLAYLLWDIIPILEKRGYYEMAVKALETLLFGKFLSRETGNPKVPQMPALYEEDRSCLAGVFLSRRARGKAFERLMIDYVHILRHQQKLAPSEAGQRKRKAAGKVVQKAPSPNEVTACLCQDLIKTCASSGQITFSATRTLAKRLKQPLSETLLGLDPYEVKELGHRYSNFAEQIEMKTSDHDKSKYSDWTPTVDHAIANSIASDESIVGKRCSYVGFDDDVGSLETGSLNVEELAMEYYRTGRLPDKDTSSIKGGWVGWHDEGGKIRTLFRVLTSAHILGMDWGCRAQALHGAHEFATIHLTPYQSAPFDLHVGAEMTGNENVAARRGFYERRRAEIDVFLDGLSCLTPEDLSGLVYEAIEARFKYTSNIQYTDPTLERDIQQVRTLSLLAAGFGGKMLSAIFRCFFFDYRHYSGGLPDLLLVRGVYPDHDSESLVDLGSWVGEAFSSENRDVLRAEQVAYMLEDRDDEFLGCSKVGDSGGRTTNWFGRGGRQSRAWREQPNETKNLKLPPRLNLSHNDRKIRVECMFVEVKSQNDRLDPRQEDWLNILDKYGNARVCKFGKPKVSKSRGRN